MEKIVKGATKIKLAAPKSKYVEAVLQATHGGEDGVAEVFRTLQIRLRDSTWTIVFKGLIIVHLMVREGQPDVTLKYIAESPKRLAISNFTEVQTQGSNIRRYSDYLLERARGYRETKIDFVRVGAGRLKGLKVEKGLLRETEAVQHQIRTLVKCDILGDNEPENEISLTAFRLLTMDLLELFKVMNEGTINVLEHYFEMSRPDAERALSIYKTFAKQTDQVVQYLSVARRYEMSTRLEVPKLKHAPTTLTSSLEEYLNDPDFEINRRQYLIQQDAKKGGKHANEGTRSTSSSSSQPTAKPGTSLPSRPAVTNPVQPPPQQARGPAPDLIDFFESIEQNQQPMAQQNALPQQFTNGFSQAPQYQPTGFSPQQPGYNPFLQSQGPTQFPQSPIQQQQQPQPLQQDFTGAGFGGYTPQPPQQQQQQQPPQSYGFQSNLPSIPQNNVSQFQPQAPVPAGQQIQSPGLQPQQTSSNPFRQASVSGGAMGATTPSIVASISRQGTNPFAKKPPGQQPLQTQQLLPQQQPDSFSFGNLAASPISTSYTSPPPMQPQQPDLQSNSAIYSSPTNQSPPPLQQLPPQRTGTNPFARNRSPPQASQPFSPPAAASPIMPNPTGSTNPFRQGAFVNQQTGLGWQHSTQGTLSGFDVNNMETRPVFPRPGQA